MSLQSFLEGTDYTFPQNSKQTYEGSPKSENLIPTRSNTPEYEKANNYENYIDKDAAMESLANTRVLSSSSSMSSVDFSDASSFEIE